ncbi:MAG: S24 family peptidase [Thiotrichaceae bacterium]
MAENQCGGEIFALQVLGDSMSPEFNEGHIIIIDPNGLVKSGCYVLAMHQGEYIFRQLQIEDEHFLLKPLNDNYPSVEIPGLGEIKGVIIQRAGTRRKEHKQYV